MLPSEKKMKAQHRDRFYYKRPRSTQDLIPVDIVYPDGMFLSNGNIYSKSYRFSDINYDTLEDKAKEGVIRAMKAMAQKCTFGQLAQITLVNRHINREMLDRLQYPQRGDGLDGLRGEMNEILESQAGRGSGIIQERYFTMSANKSSAREAQIHFDRAGNEIGLAFAGMGARFAPIELSERLRILHDFYRPGDENYWQFDFEDRKRRKISFKDSIAPMSFLPAPDCVKIGTKYVRVLAMTKLAAWVDDDTVTNLIGLDTEMILSVSFMPVTTDEAVKHFQRKLDSLEANSMRFQQKQLQRTHIAVPEPYNFRNERNTMTDSLNDITVRDCGLVVLTVTLAHMASSLEKLDADTELIRNVVRGNNCDLNVCTEQQLDALNTVLPFGLDRISIDHSITTETMAALVPFKAQEICDPTGVLYGQNAVTRNLVVVDRLAKSSGNGFVLGMTGGGKSFFCKNELVSLRLKYPPDKADFLLLDPEQEYGKVVTELGGEVYHVGQDSINPFDLELDMDERNPLAYKTEFITTFCEKVSEGDGLDAQTKSLIDRAIRAVYRDFLKSKGKYRPPLLGDFRLALQKMNNPRSEELALSLERFVDGALNTFSKPTNIDTGNSLICYSLSGLRDQMKPIGTLITLDHLLGRVMRNYKAGKITFVYADEFALLFQDEDTGKFFSNLWRRIRKYNGYCTGATQNVEEVLDSESGRAMLSNTDFVVMLNQSPSNAQRLSELYKITENQRTYFTNTQPGHGLMKIGGAMIPFVSTIPADTKLYRLLSTNPREGKWN
ncbi:VirB4-like conjugal transfer ATPase, CD1110 family [Acutalibacter intestini]|uniref:VirB4-like conjugal transfer ATPase, CD1110 family n=1 Tax=Acutalibacter intestini TaxID=3093659 RepID=UPI002AC8C3EB|nr:FtsK/SpoIIIE domain-containing protein [Acutalibacter sp. M00204]